MYSPLWLCHLASRWHSDILYQRFGRSCGHLDPIRAPLDEPSRKLVDFPIITFPFRNLFCSFQFRLFRERVLTQVDYEAGDVASALRLTKRTVLELTGLGVLQTVLTTPSLTPEPRPIQSMYRQLFLHRIR